MERLALEAAQLAVQRDREGRFAEAVQQYDSCVALLVSCNKPELFAQLVDNYRLRSRLLKLRIFEQNKDKPPSVTDRLKELRGVKDSPVPTGHVVLADVAAEEDDGDEDEQSRRILAQVQAELALEEGTGVADAKSSSPPLGRCSSSSSEAVSPDNSDDDSRMLDMKAKARAEQAARKQRVKKRFGK
jgi:hypothetical protein